MTDVAISFRLNGEARTDTVPASLMLVDYLHERFDLRGARIGCSRGACGACTVLLDGMPVAGCSVFAFQLDGKALTTIEGLARPDGTLDRVQQAFVDHAAFQCGYCTSGMILLVTAMLAHEAAPTRETVVDWISSNICRCTGYAQIIAAVEAVLRDGVAA